MQHNWLHLCFPQDLFFIHLFSHRASSAFDIKSLQAISLSMFPQRHLTLVIKSQTGQSPTWHFTLHLWGLSADNILYHKFLLYFIKNPIHLQFEMKYSLGCPHFKFFKHILSQTGIESKQVCLLSINGVCPQQQVVILSGVKEQDSQASAWHNFVQVWLPHSNNLPQIVPQEYVNEILLWQVISFVLLPQ